MSTILPPLKKLKPSSSAFCIRRKYTNVKLIQDNGKLRRKNSIVYAMGLKQAKSLLLITHEAGAQNTDPQKPKSDLNEPIVDSEINSVIQITTIHKRHGKIVLEVIPPIPPITDPNFEEILLKKINFCKNTFDFSDPTSETKEKDMKTRTLCELVTFFEQSFDAKKINENIQHHIFEMIHVNVFREMPLIDVKRVLFDYSAILVEPSWPHLFYIYNILNTFAQIFPRSPELTYETCVNAIFLTNFPDHNERLQLIAFLRTFYDNHKQYEAQIVNKIKSNLIDVIDKSKPPFCVMPLLVFLSHIISRSNNGRSEFYMNLIREAVFPLVTSPYLPGFNSHLAALISNVFLTKDKIVTDFADYLFFHWPRGNSAKAICFLELILFSISKMSLEKVSGYARHLVQILKEALLAPYNRIKDVILDIFLATKLPLWIEQESNYIISELYFPVRQLALENTIILREKANLVLQVFGRLNKTTFVRMRGLKNDLAAAKKYTEHEREVARRWTEMIAGQKTKITGFNTEQKKKEIKAAFKYKIDEVNSLFVV